MRSKLIKIITGLIAFSTVYATDVSGVISSNTTWTKANSPFSVTGNVLVNSGVTLTIEAGVTVNFSGAYYLQVEGTLSAIGTAADSIIFTGSGWKGIDLKTAGSTIKYSRINGASSYGTYIKIKGSELSNSHIYDVYYGIEATKI